MKKKPVYLLKKNDVFLAEDGHLWTVDEVIEPEGWRSLPQIGEKPKVFTILAHKEQSNRSFYYHSIKLVDIK